MVELTVFTGFMNMAGRINTAHGIASQGYPDACATSASQKSGASKAASTA
jgi:hypothetical protein